MQALFSPTGPSGACVQLALKRNVQLFISSYVVAELREAPNKRMPAKLEITAEKVERLIGNLMIAATFIDDIPHLFEHPIDPDDSPYIDLALAAQSNLIISRDRHLLGLSDPGKQWSVDFRRRFPALCAIPPEVLLALSRR
jgi:putative PIN family toxin of toxin-antitoxin system